MWEAALLALSSAGAGGLQAEMGKKSGGTCWRGEYQVHVGCYCGCAEPSAWSKSWSQYLSSPPHLAVTAALSCMGCTVLSGAPHLGHDWGPLGVQEHTLVQGVAQADAPVHPPLPGHASHFSNWLFLKTRGYLLWSCKFCEFVGLREMQEEMVKGDPYSQHQ